ncbi:MAG: FAD-binding oxidoreductase [Gemmatimonadetes bacterium]|nr:FAD-binding oxidoreductase [Gemmatimonadota bacterium]
MSPADVLAGLLPRDEVREGGTPIGGATPEATVSPGSVEEVVEVLRAASAEGFGVVPSGSGADLGASAPTGPFVVLSTTGLKGVEMYEPADLTLSAQAGSTLGEIGDVAGPHGQWLPFDPPFAPSRTLGGLAATGVRGPLAASYGAPRDHILGLTLVTGDGRLLRLGGRVMKNVAGFDLVRLVVGSRGTLGVIVSVNVRLFPRPAHEVGLVLEAATSHELVTAARAVATAPVLPASAVLVSGLRAEVGADASSADASRTPKPPSLLVLRIHGAPETVAADSTRLQAHVGRSFRVVEGAEAFALLTAVRDHAMTGPIVIRVSALPNRIGDVLAGAEALGDTVQIMADPIAGRVRAAVSGASTEGLEQVAHAAARLGGGYALERAPVGVSIRVPGSSPDGPVATLARGLADRFDPQRVLWPGKRVT